MDIEFEEVLDNIETELRRLHDNGAMIKGCVLSKIIKEVGGNEVFIEHATNGEMEYTIQLYNPKYDRITGKVE